MRACTDRLLRRCHDERWCKERLPLALPANLWEAGNCMPEFCLPARTAAPTGAPATSPLTHSTGAPVIAILQPHPRPRCCKITAFRKQINGGDSPSTRPSA
eukprot:TRINITY_DN28328_c0_g1_i1.p3 TRINITY_DN28328_c0_g1~~TRINITY_DN28328_c0_g1_i1.p3  ORF type:complete len:101 (+),score=12.18 TRINITY_DN28328_c0_g1_i1:71-373(+)